LAGAVGAEIISVDSMKVYRGLDIGTAKPSRAVREAIPFHMVDILEPAEPFSMAKYLEGAFASLAEIGARGRRALFVGGTPLYLRGLLYGIFDGPAADWAARAELMRKAEALGPEALHEELRRVDAAAAKRLHPNDLVRIIRALEVARATGRPISSHQRQYPAPAPRIPCRLAALRREDADLRRRISRRVERMFSAGLVDEVRRTLERGGFSRSAEKAIGYREVLRHLKGEFSLEETVELVRRNTWRLARKQRSWLKSFPGVAWLDIAPDEPPEKTAARVRGLLFGGPESWN
jgi:tRNA dimethylallyltransferase